ncbi:MAG: transposase [Blastocatellia bacterium]|nr:transposase [Blastocatellia bacterium]
METPAPVNRKITYRMYPTPRQEALLVEWKGLHQRLYNAGLEERVKAYRLCRVSVSFADQCKSVTEIRAGMPEYAALNAQSLQVTLKRLDLAFAHFFRRVREGAASPGFPRFKSFDRYPGWGYKTYGDGWKLEGQTADAKSGMRHGFLKLSGIGRIKLRGQARTPGQPKTCEILHKQGRWYASVTVACQPHRQRGTQGAAFDWGVETLATLALADGTYDEIPNPRTGKPDADRKAELQKELAAKQRRSRNRQKTRRKLARHCARTAHRRKDFLHQESARLVKRSALLVTEKLTVKNMTAAPAPKPDPDQPGHFLPNGAAAKAGLNREILDTAPATFLNLLARKAEEAAVPYVEVPTRNVKPSQSCSGCGHQRKKPLSERMHHCPHCQLKLSRDRNAARCLLNWVLFGTVYDPHSGLERAEVRSASGDAPVQESPAITHGV